MNGLITRHDLFLQITPRRPPRPEGDKERRNSRPLSSQFPSQPLVPGGSYSNSTPNISSTNSIFYTTGYGFLHVSCLLTFTRCSSQNRHNPILKITNAISLKFDVTEIILPEFELNITDIISAIHLNFTDISVISLM